MKRNKSVRRALVIKGGCLRKEMVVEFLARTINMEHSNAHYVRTTVFIDGRKLRSISGVTYPSKVHGQEAMSRAVVELWEICDRLAQVLELRSEVVNWVVNELGICTVDYGYVSDEQLCNFREKLNYFAQLLDTLDLLRLLLLPEFVPIESVRSAQNRLVIDALLMLSGGANRYCVVEVDLALRRATRYFPKTHREYAGVISSLVYCAKIAA